jgi:hypothetical protein
MSLTGTHHIFGGISETGLNNFLNVFFTARPHLLAYGSAYYAGDPTQVTLIDLSSLPFALSGLQFLLQLQIPSVDITPANSAGELLPPGPDQFTIFTEVLIRFLCGPSIVGITRVQPPHEIDVTFNVAALCAPRVIDPTPGTGTIGIDLVELEITGIAPEGLEEILECILTALLRGALSQVIVPFSVFTLDGVSLTLQQGPIAAANQIEVFGDIS